MKTTFKKLFSLLLACACLAALLAIAFHRIRVLGPGVQIFTLDDAYISAGIARHVFLTHTWGVSPHAFSSASSSILWPLMLAGSFAVFGVHMWVAFAWNVLLAMLVLCLGWRIVGDEIPEAPAWCVFFVLTIVAVVTPLPMMAFIGMEHIAFALASLAFMYISAKKLSQTHAHPLDARDLIALALLAAFACSLRYEGMFQCAIVGGLFLLRKEIRAMLVVAFGGALPIVIFGIFCIRRGAHFFPNSLLQKAGPPTHLLHSVVVFAGERGLLSHFSLQTGLFAIWLFVILLLLRSLLEARPDAAQSNAALANPQRLSLTLRYCLAIFTGTVILHCQFGHLNWLWRYESYLMCTGTLFLFTGLYQFATRKAVGEKHTESRENTSREKLAAVLIGCITLIAVSSRAWNSYADIPHSAYAIYEQQYQTGMFLTRFYRGQPIVLNDIGVPGYKSDAQILDLAGLGSLEVTDLQIAHRFNTQAIVQLAAEKHSRIAILYRYWFKGATAPPASWTEVGSWTVPAMDPRTPIVDHTFTFFAVTPAEIPYLHDSLCANRRFVPTDEVQVIATPCGSAH